MTEIIIKNMVCPRCLEAVRQIFEQLQIPITDLRLGRAQTSISISAPQKKFLQQHLIEKGFEWLDDKQAQLINSIKSIIIQNIHHQTDPLPVNFSTLLAETLHYDYTYLSRLFSAVESRTIERFIMAQKVEKIKELLTYDELTISEIAFQMHYSSAAHLSAQFKKITGLSPSVFKKQQQQDRQFLDEV